MFDTTTLKKRCHRLLGPTCLMACLATAGCIDNSGNKTYPRGDAAVDAGEPETAEDAPADAPASETANDVPAGDSPADLPAVDTHTDVPALDSPTDLSAIETAAGDVHADTGSGG
jgi:hypothetical protein